MRDAAAATTARRRKEPANNNTKAEEKTDNKESAGTGKFELGSEPLEFSFYGHYDWYTMPSWGADEASKWIQDNKK